ncbi:carbonic anhydrase family protein [Striga asiatica]|uniref:Carbonic anhydrase family protein n=1 Tax=Striga asiatica TaxID=4170 RepID=A0A5A7R503_STRAF|nr:carbonic anhydrase family protein [Striga asiatica]
MSLNSSFLHILLGCLLLSSLIFTVNSNALGAEYESSFSYVLGAENGPHKWGKLNRNSDLCGSAWTGDAGGITIKGSEHKLLQCHCHIPAEHTVNGVRFDTELHVVHNTSAGNVAVLSILYKIGEPDFFFSKIIPYLKSIGTEGANLGAIDPWSIGLSAKADYYRYYGSLTTPPCTENVTWTIFKTVRTASAEQVRALRDALDDVSDISSSLDKYDFLL